MSDISLEQLAANRQNGKKGGVKTDEGKAVSRYNAMKHGLLAKDVLLEDETEADLVALGRKMRTELVPETELEMVLVDRIVANVWRLRRVMRIEREMIVDHRNDVDYLMKPATKTLGSAFSDDFANHDTYGKLIRYETSIERGIYRALHELQRLQAARAGGNVALPAVVDIDLSGAT